ncbi:MAG TPA: hypothetical protein VII49_00875 [Rhizomicrobium sp.]
MAWSWDFMLQVFRSLGGKADNIARTNGPGGRGLVALDPGKSVLLHAPPNLIFPVGDVEFVQSHLRIRNGAKIGNAEKTFFENYYDAFSWGSGGRAESVAFINALAELPAEVRALLSADFGLAGLAEGGDARAEQWFLRSRRFRWRDVAVLVPVLELVDHGADANPYGEENGVTIATDPSEDILVLRSKVGPFGAFLRFGFASPERVAFSLPMTFGTEGGCEIVIGQNINTNSTMGSLPVPDYEVDGAAVRFSCLMIGNARLPRVSRGIFYRVMKEAGQPNPEQVFDVILHKNRLAFLGLLEAIEPYEGGLIPALRKAARHQLEAMSWCIGAREL